MKTDPRHQCMIYGGFPSHGLPVLASIIQAKLQEGYRCLYLNSAPMVAGMLSTLAAMNVEIKAELDKKRLILSSDPVTTNGEFNIKAMLEQLEATLDQALSEGFKGLWASGDMTWEFGPKKDFSKLMDYELALDALLARRKELCGVCQYHEDTLPREALQQSLLVHPAFVVNNTLTQINPHYMQSNWPPDPGNLFALNETLSRLSAR